MPAIIGGLLAIAAGIAILYYVLLAIYWMLQGIGNGTLVVIATLDRISWGPVALAFPDAGVLEHCISSWAITGALVGLALGLYRGMGAIERRKLAIGAPALVLLLLGLVAASGPSPDSPRPRDAPRVVVAVPVPAKVEPEYAVPRHLAVYGPDGIEVDGDRWFSKPVDGAVVDANQELLWFSSQNTIQVIDLRDSSGHAPIVVAKNTLAGAFAIDGLSKAQFGMEYAETYTSLRLTKTPRVSLERTPGSAATPTASGLRPALVAAGWVAKQQRRAPKHSRPAPSRGKAPAVRLPPEYKEELLVDRVCDGDGYERCGHGGRSHEAGLA